MRDTVITIPPLGGRGRGRGRGRPPRVPTEQRYPALVPGVMGEETTILKETTILQNWCLRIVVSPWFKCVSILVVLLNCMSLVMSPPGHERSFMLLIVDTFVLVFFIIETLLKMLAMGVYGHPGSYLGDNWNKFELFINAGELLSYSMELSGMVLCPVLGSMRIISRIMSLREVMTVLLNTLPMLGNVLFLYIFVIHVFGVMGVQLWAGQLRNRCFLGENISTTYNVSLDPYYTTKYDSQYPYICSPDSMNGMRRCHNLPPLKEHNQTCSLTPPHYAPGVLGPTVPGATANTCINWNVLYNVCRAGDQNPSRGAINFDNIGYAWITMFQVLTLEGWSNIMSYVMDAYSFWSFIFFILSTITGSFIMMNVCSVIISAQFTDNLSEMIEKQNQRRAANVAFIRGLYLKLTGCLKRIRRKFRRNRSNRVQCEGAARRTRDSTIRIVWRPYRIWLNRVVKHKIFQRVIMFAVVLSIFTMAIEHHLQPKELTYVLEISNLLFTVIFVVEMVIKLMALGLMYFKDKDNIFDFVIAIISLWETRTEAKGRLSVLRVFRLLRFGRLLHYLPHLRKQLLVLKRAITEASSLCLGVLYIIFIFSLIGRHLFSDQINTKTIREPDRNLFDTLLWSMVTVFQILTKEDWNLVLYNTMAATSPLAFLYFLAIILMGEHILLNLLVGIVIDGFQKQRAKEQSSNPDFSQSADVTSEPPVTPEEGPAATNTNRLSQREAADVVTVPPPPPSPPTQQRSKKWIRQLLRWCREREEWSFYVLSPDNRFRIFCQRVISYKMFDFTVMFFILLNVVTIAEERPEIHPESMEQLYLNASRYVFFVVFLVEMLFKILALGLLFGSGSYCRSNWNVLDGLLVVLSLVDIFFSLVSLGQNKMLVIIKVLRMLRTFRPLRVIKRAPKLKLAVEALIKSVKPIGNIFLICCAFLFFYAILGVQLFKGKFYSCSGENLDHITNKTECLSANYSWQPKFFNFDSLPQALLAMFVMYSKDGWVAIMHDGVDAVEVDVQPVMNYNEWILIYFLTFMVVSFFLLDMFIGVMVDTFFQCQQEQKRPDEAEQSLLHIPVVESVVDIEDAVDVEDVEGVETNYWTSYSRTRLWVHTLCTNKYLDFSMGIVIFISVLIMAVEHYGQPLYVTLLIEYSSKVFTIILIMEVSLKLVAFGVRRFIKNSWNVIDLVIILVSVLSIILTKIDMAETIPINPSILRVCRVLRLAQVLKAKKIRIMLKTIIKTLTQVGNVCLLFLFFFYIYAALGVEIFGHLECVDKELCLGINNKTNFKHFGMALLTLFQVCTGDNWSGIMKDTMAPCRPGDEQCSNYLVFVSPVYFISFVVTVQFVLVNLVVAVIMQAMEDSKLEDHLSREQLARQQLAIEKPAEEMLALLAAVPDVIQSDELPSDQQ